DVVEVDSRLYATAVDHGLVAGTVLVDLARRDARPRAMQHELTVPDAAGLEDDLVPGLERHAVDLGERPPWRPWSPAVVGIVSVGIDVVPGASGRRQLVRCSGSSSVGITRDGEVDALRHLLCLATDSERDDPEILRCCSRHGQYTSTSANCRT